MSQDIPLYEPSRGAPLSQIPADEVLITDYRVMPWPDGTRVTIELGLTPFRQFPAMDVSLVKPDGVVARHVSVVGTLERRPSPTMWLPQLPLGTPMLALIEMINNDNVYQEYRIEFEVGGPIIKRVLVES